MIPQGDSFELSSIRGLTTTRLIDNQGRIVVIYAGAMKEDVFRQFAVVIFDEVLTWGTRVAVARVPVLEYPARGFARPLATGGL